LNLSVLFRRHQGGGRSTKKFLPAQINPFITDEYAPLAGVDRLMYHSHGSPANMLPEVAHDSSKVLAVMPLRILASELTKIQHKEIAAVHKIAMPNRGLIDQLVAAVVNHECHCEPTVFVFEVLKNVTELQTASHRARNIAYKSRARANPKDPKGKFKASEALRGKRKLDQLAAKSVNLRTLLLQPQMCRSRQPQRFKA
jgi:hypothetical protein